MKMEFVARYLESDGAPQKLMDHLEGTSVLASQFAWKIGLPHFGELMGLLHDLGKYSKEFQSYLKSSGGKIEPDDEEYIDASRMKGKIDHSTAGAQYLRNHCKSDCRFWQIAMEIMALCLVSHHSGLIDCLAPDASDVFTKRMGKNGEKSHIGEVDENLEEQIRSKIQTVLGFSQIADEIQYRLAKLGQGVPSLEVGQFMLGFAGR